MLKKITCVSPHLLGLKTKYMVEIIFVQTFLSVAFEKGFYENHSDLKSSTGNSLWILARSQGMQTTDSEDSEMCINYIIVSPLKQVTMTIKIDLYLLSFSLSSLSLSSLRFRRS